MNFLVIYPEEVKDNKAILIDDRATDVIKRHDLKEGLEISALIYNGKRGKVRVASAGKVVELDLNMTEEALDKDEVHLIVGLSRPQTIKKVIAASLAMGVSDLYFVMSSQSEKSYLSSKALLDENIKKEVLLAMEQTGESIAPRIIVYDKFKPFVEDILPKIPSFDDSNKIIADTKSAEQVKPSNKPLYCSVGAEKGWSEYELSRFLELGFKPLSLGKRVLRVEQAVIAMLAKF